MMKPEKAAWLASTLESPLDPARPIIDPHHHLWDRSGSRYLVEELHADTGAGHNIVGSVFVECLSCWHENGPPALRPVGETAFVAHEAARAKAGGASLQACAPILGIVSHADLTLGAAVQAVLTAHEEAGQGLFRGIRHPTALDADIGPGHIPAPAGLMDTSAFREGFVTLGRMGYSFDAWLFHPQLDELLRLVQTHPDTPVVLDHIGAPLGVASYEGKRKAVREQWRAAMQRLADCPSVVVKVGGIGMNRYLGGGWPKLSAPPTSAQLYDYWGDDLRWCVDTFGPARCMFESNFPVDRESCNYTVLWNTLQRVGAHYSADEQHELFHDTAARTYRLLLPTT